MHCKSCEGEGFVEYFTQRDGKMVPNLQRCPAKCPGSDVKYSREVSKRYAQAPLKVGMGQLVNFPGVSK